MRNPKISSSISKNQKQVLAAAVVIACLAVIATAQESQYDTKLIPADIAPTPATMAKADVEVAGQPRMTKGHPCTLWDQEDIARLKGMLGSNKELQESVASLQTAMDARIAQPLGVPEPGQNGTERSDYAVHHKNVTTISNLGILYALTGEAKYGEYCRKMLVAYAKGFPTYNHYAGWTPQRYRSAQDGRLTHQFLADGQWLVQSSFGYDLVYNLPSWTEEERKAVRDDLLEGLAKLFYEPILKDKDYLNGVHNRSALCTSGVLMAGYASENPKLVELALYGQKGTKEKPLGGVFGTHFSEACIMPDGLWIEGAPHYQVGIASCGLFNDAETLWHHGIDLYRYRGGVLKRLLDSPPALAFPDAKMTVAALHDSGRLELLDDKGWFNNELGLPYEYGYRRYQDPNYLPIIRHATQQISMTIHGGGPSLFLELPKGENAPTRTYDSANFYSVGYGVLRLPTAKGGLNQLLMEYGRSDTGHAHPSKLGLDLYALGDELMNFPGVIFPYGDPMDVKWYETTLANCALTVDEKSQLFRGNLFAKKQPGGEAPKNRHDRTIPEALQLVFGPASTMGMQRAWSDTVQPGVTEDRSVFLTPQYLADVFGAFSNAPHQYDLAWHFRGKLTSTLKLTPWQFPEPVANGYNALTEVSHTTTDQAWSANITNPKGNVARFLAAGGTGTEIVSALGHFRVWSEPKDEEGEAGADESDKTEKKAAGKGKGAAHVDEQPPTIIERRTKTNSALYGNVTDLSGDANGYVKSVTQSGGIAPGYGLLKVETVKGTDLCFASFRPGSYKAEGLETDGQQALVLRDGQRVRAMYLAGGKLLRTAEGTIERSEPGLAYVEVAKAGSYILGNPSPAKATVTMALPALTGMKAYYLDQAGKRTGPAGVTSGTVPNSFAVQLEPDSKVEFSSTP